MRACVWLLLFSATAAAQESAPPPSWDDGFRAGVEAAREKPVYDWLAIGGGASLLTSGCATPFVGPAAFVIERPRISVPDADPSCGAAYSLGWDEGFEITVKRRRAAAGWLGAGTMAFVLAAGLGIFNYQRAQKEGEASLVASPMLFRF